MIPYKAVWRVEKRVAAVSYANLVKIRRQKLIRENPGTMAS